MRINGVPIKAPFNPALPCRVRIADLTWLPRSYGDIKTVVTPDAEELQQQKRERHTSGSADTSGGGWGERVPRHDLSSARQRNMTSHT